MDSRASIFINSLGIISNKIYQENLTFERDLQNKIDYLNKKKKYSDADILKLEKETNKILKSWKGKAVPKRFKK